MKERDNMNSTKIIVIQLKELIMTIIFSLIGVILLGILIYIFIPKDKPASQNNIYIPGKYTSSIMLGDKSVDVEVVVDTNKITAIDFRNLEKEQEVFYPLAQPTLNDMSEKIISTQSLDMSISEDTDITANLLLEAISEAVDKASVKE